MPRFRFTVRRMMVAVAIVCVMVYGIRLLIIRSNCIKKFYYFEQMGNMYGPGVRDGFPDERLSRYYHALAAKYSRAARYPWLHFAPDPPEPE